MTSPNVLTAERTVLRRKHVVWAIQRSNGAWTRKRRG